MKNLRRYEKAIDPDEEFLQDIEQRKSLEDAYLAAETKVITIFDAAESVKEQFYRAIDDVFRQAIEPVHDLCEAIANIKHDFESSPRAYLGNDCSTHVERIVSKESPQKSPSSKGVLTVDIKSILTQKLVTQSPKQKPYIPLGGSSENSPSNPNDDQKVVHASKDDMSSTPNKEPSKLISENEKEHVYQLIVESQESNTSQACASDNDKVLEPSKESGNLASQLSINNDENSVGPDNEIPKLAPDATNTTASETKQHEMSQGSTTGSDKSLDTGDSKGDGLDTK